MPVWNRSSSLNAWAGGCALAVVATACSLGDFDSLGAGPDQNIGGSGGSGGSAGSAGTAGNGGSGGGGSGGDSGSAGVGGSGTPAGVNIIEDPGFEAGTSEWTPLGGCSSVVIEDPTPRPDSTRCLLTTNRTLNWMGPSFNLAGKTDGGRRYRVSVWVRMDGGGDAGPGTHPVGITQKRMCSTDAAPGLFSPLITGVSVGAEWKEVTATFTAPDCEVIQESVLYVEGPDPGVEYCIDDTVIEALD